MFGGTEATAASKRLALLVSIQGYRRSSKDGHDSTGDPYGTAFEAFRPLLERMGEVIPLDQPESRLEFAIRKARQRGLEPLHLGFQPLNEMYLTRSTPNINFPFWDFPQIPDDDEPSSRHNWPRIGNRCSLILTANDYTASSLAAGGIGVPVQVVPVPLADELFRLPLRRLDETAFLECDAYVFGPSADTTEENGVLSARTWPSLRTRIKRAVCEAARRTWVRAVKPCIPPRILRALLAAKNAARASWRDSGEHRPPPSVRLELSGVVYAAVVDPTDERSNWEDLLSAFLAALGSRDDATLVLQLATQDSLRIQDVLNYFARLKARHRCRICFVVGFVPDERQSLPAASTYYLSASRADGAALTLQQFLAAGRPAVAPRHSALAECFDDGAGFVVAADPAPCFWPDYPHRGLTASCCRPLWTSLRDEIAESYKVATLEPRRYVELAAAARDRTAARACYDAVWPTLIEALETVTAPRGIRRLGVPAPASRLRIVTCDA